MPTLVGPPPERFISEPRPGGPRIVALIQIKPRRLTRDSSLLTYCPRLQRGEGASPPMDAFVQAGCSAASELKELLALHEAALESMAHGLCMIDAGQRLTLYNQRFIETFNLDPAAVYSGMPIAELM